MIVIFIWIWEMKAIKIWIEEMKEYKDKSGKKEAI